MTNPAKKVPSTPVKKGQTWMDNDPRLSPRKRFVKVASVSTKHAHCETWYYDTPGTVRFVRILLSRFRPISTGYKLVRDEKGEAVK